MNTLYTYHLSPKISELLLRIEVAKKVIDLLPQLPKIEANLRHKSLLKSSLFSARIEGNTIELHELEDKARDKRREKQEVFNIVKALEWIYSNNSPSTITSKTLAQLHNFVMQELSPDIGTFRKEPTAIFNTAGIAIYMTPPPSHLPYLIDELISFISTSTEHPAIIASYSHFTFEKIHPFVDGNGRIGRLLSSLILKNKDYAMHGIVSIEEYLNDHKENYYDLLNNTSNDITSFIEFYLEAIAESSESSFEKIKDIKEENPQDRLLPRRQEIIAIIKDHPHSSFDSIKRRFPATPASTLHYDIQVLVKNSFIKKLGSTRGTVYTSK